MSGRELPSPLLVVTDRHGNRRPLVETVQAVLAGGCRWVWFRDRDLPPGERRVLAKALLATVRAAGGALSVGGDPDLAAAIGADGVHLGGDTDVDAIATARRKLGAQAWIGVSVHSLTDVATAASSGADYVTLSPIFDTASKPGYGPSLGLSAIQAACSLGIPIVALGGITPDTASTCRAVGAAGVAVLGGLMRACDPASQARHYLASISETR